MYLTTLLKDAIKNGEKVDVIIGDGIDPMRQIHTVYKTAYRDTIHSNPNRLLRLDQKAWPHYEHIRHFTTNARPTDSYDLILHLAIKGLLRSVITTNYDTTLDALFYRFKKYISNKVIQNPVLDPDEWEYFGYCGEKSTEDSIELWKIHGSLNYLFCRGCMTILKCPDFVLPFNDKTISELFSHPISHTYIPGHAYCCPIPKPPSDISESLCQHYVHLTDWNIINFKSIDPFKKILNGVSMRLTTDTKNIIILGFKGNESYELINDAAQSLDGSNVKWAMYLSETQRDSVESGADHWHLRDIVLNNGGEFNYYNTGDLAIKVNKAMVDSNLITLTELHKFRNLLERKYINRNYWDRHTA